MNGPLSIKTSTTSTAIPLIADGQLARFRVNGLTLDQKEGTLFPQVRVDARLLDPTPSAEGTTLNPGFPLFITFPLGSKEDPNTIPEWSVQALAKFQDGVLGTGDAGNKKDKVVRPDFTQESFPDYIGKEFFAKVGVRKSKDEQYGDSNVVKTYTFPGDIAA